MIQPKTGLCVHRYLFYETKAPFINYMDFLFIVNTAAVLSASGYVHPADDNLADGASGLSGDDVFDLRPVCLTELVVV